MRNFLNIGHPYAFLNYTAHKKLRILLDLIKKKRTKRQMKMPTINQNYEHN
jgi:hypothetical protein